jgi:hypothetical protein
MADENFFEKIAPYIIVPVIGPGPLLIASLAGCSPSAPPDPVESVDPPTLKKSPLRKAAVIVAQVNYPDANVNLAGGNEETLFKTAKSKDKTQGGYGGFAIKLKNYLLAENDGTPDYSVIIFNFLSGTVIQYSKGSEDGSPVKGFEDKKRILFKNYRYRVPDTDEGMLRLESIAEKKPKYYPGLVKMLTNDNPDGEVAFKEYSPKSDSDLAKHPEENGLSIEDVYDFLGSGEYSILEFHLIGHAWISGPIILNCIKWNSKKFDRDCRFGDFDNVNLQPVFGSDFSRLRQHLDPKLRTVIWGCSFNNKHRADIDNINKETDSEKKTKKIKAAKIKLIREYVIKESYAYKLSTALGKPVYAALPGLESINDDKSFKPQMLHVNYNGNFSWVIDFYKDHLGFEIPKDGLFAAEKLNFGRGYAKYDAQQIDALNKTL